MNFWNLWFKLGYVVISCECNSSHIDTIESQLHRSRFRTFESSLSMVGYLAGGLGPFRNQDWTQRTCQGSGVWGRVMHAQVVEEVSPLDDDLVLLSCSIFLVVAYEQSSCIINISSIIIKPSSASFHWNSPCMSCRCCPASPGSGRESCFLGWFQGQGWP